MKLYDAIRSKALRRATVAAAILALGGGVGASLIARRLPAVGDPFAISLAAIIGAAGLAFPAVAAGLVLHFLDENRRQLEALAAIRPLMGDLPMPLGRWAIDALFGALIVHTASSSQPDLIVECGAGTSTVLAAECLRRLGRGRVISLEHNPDFAELTRRQLADRGLQDIARVVTAPIEPRDIDGISWPWYAESADAHLDAPIDLLIVDGPNRQIGTEARFPAVPLLQHRLAPDAIILMDDGNRSDETRIAFKWARRLNASKSLVRGGKGAWILRRDSESA